MDPYSVPSLPAAISAPRLAPYLHRYGGNVQLGVRLYAWNLELSGAFWGPISVLEITLRNAMHEAMSANRADKDWWNLSVVNLESREDKQIDSAMDKLANAGNYRPSADDVVAATSMGLWVGLLGVGVARHHLYDYESRLWPRLQSAFVNRGGLGRRQIHAKLNRVRVLRNRIAHHEPLLKLNHAEQRDLIIECVGLIDSDMANYVAANHRIDSVIAGKQMAVTSGACSF